MALSVVMAGLGPAIHVFDWKGKKTWMPATSAGMTSQTLSSLGSDRLFAQNRQAPQQPALVCAEVGAGMERTAVVP
jgi:hypothetical protein